MRSERRWVLLHEARMELVAIARHTRKVWGAHQRQVYLARLETRFNWLAANPELGKNRSVLREGLFSYAEGSHLIFYLVKPDRIEIIGIAHKAMDIDSYLASGTDD